MTASNNHEKRKHSRVGFATDIEILLQSGEKAVTLKGSSKDLSLRGMFAGSGSGERFEPGTQCGVSIFLTGGIEKIELRMKGTVVRSSDRGMGIEFDSMDVDTYSHLKNIVYYNSGDGSI